MSHVCLLFIYLFYLFIKLNAFSPELFALELLPSFAQNFQVSVTGFQLSTSKSLSIKPHPHYMCVAVAVSIASKLLQDGVSSPMPPNFEFRIVLLDWLPNKAKEPTLLYYLTHNWEGAEELDSCLSQGILHESECNGLD